MTNLITVVAQVKSTIAPVPNVTATAGGQAPHAASFDPTSGLAYLLYLLLFVAVLIVITPLLLRKLDSRLFDVPYITWYLLHFTVATLGIIAVVVLAVTGTITGEVVSALLGSLFGYVLGNAAARSASGASANTPLTIATLAVLPAGTVGTPYTQTLLPAGGHGPYSWAVPVGMLPPGLALDGTTGTVSGTPTTVGHYVFTAQVTDSSHATAPKIVTMAVS